MFFSLLQRDALNLEPSNVANCVSKGKSEVGFFLTVRFALSFALRAVFEKNFNSGTGKLASVRLETRMPRNSDCRKRRRT